MNTNSEFRLPASDIVFLISPGREVLRITADGKVIVSGDTYESAVAFWEILTAFAANHGITLDKRPA